MKRLHLSSNIFYAQSCSANFKCNLETWLNQLKADCVLNDKQLLNNKFSMREKNSFVQKRKTTFPLNIKLQALLRIGYNFMKF